MQDIFDTLNPVDEKAAPVSDIFDQLNPVTTENKSSSSTPETDKAVAQTAVTASRTSRMPATGPEARLPDYGALKAGKVQFQQGAQLPDSPLVPPEVFQAGMWANPVTAVPMAINYAVAPRIEQGFERGTAETLSGFTTPSNAPLLTAAPFFPEGVVGKVLGTALGGAFEAQQIIHDPEQFKQLKSAWDKGDYGEVARIGSQMFTGHALPAIAPFVAAKGAKPISSAEQAPVVSEFQPKIEEVIQPEKTQEGQAVAGAERPQETETLATAGAETTPPAPETLTGIAQRVHAERADLGRQGEILPGEGVSAEEMVHRGRFLVDSGANPDVVLQQMKETGHLSGDSLAILRAKHQDLGKLTDQAHDEWMANPDNPQARINYDQAWGNETAWAQQIKPFQTEWHKIGQAMQGETDINTGSFSGLRRGVFEEKGRDVLPEEVPKLTKMAEKVQQATREVDQARSKYDEIIKQDAVRRVPKTVDQLREHFSNRIRELTPC